VAIFRVVALRPGLGISFGLAPISRKDSGWAEMKNSGGTPRRLSRLPPFRSIGVTTMQGSSSISLLRRRGEHLLNATLEGKHISFAGIWDANLRAQGSLEALVKQQKDDT